MAETVKMFNIFSQQKNAKSNYFEISSYSSQNV